MSATTAASDSADDVRLPLMKLSPEALETVVGIRAEEPDPENLGLRVEIVGESGTDFVYDLSFDEIDAAQDDDVVEDSDGVMVIVPALTVDRLRGSVLDVAANGGGLVIRNPHRPDPLAGLELDLKGTVSEKITALLEASINPSLASHGGFATLVGVEDESVAYITMGGGCQGCAMSRQTLTEGIQKQILELIPEVKDVVDATDHAAGENPFF